MSLAPRFVLGDLDLTDYPFMVPMDEMDLGAGDNVAAVVDTLLLDGESISSARTSNRTLSVPVVIEGADMLELAEAEAALMLECDRQRNEFAVEPGDGIGASTVFDTFRAQVTHQRSDDYEAAFLRRYTLTIPALPFPRSADVAETTFVPGGGGAPTEVDPATATTNWGGTNMTWSTATYNTIPVIQYDGPTEFLVSTLVWSGAVPAAAYVALDIAWASGSWVDPRLNGDAPISVEHVPAGPFVRYWFPTPASGPLTLSWTWPPGKYTPLFYVGGLYSAAAAPSANVYVADVPGAVRSEGSIVVTRAAGLSDVVVYSDPAMISHGFNPAKEASWPTSPAGRYMVYVRDGALPAGTSGNSLVVQATANGVTQTIRTLLGGLPVSSGWIPVGVVSFGGNRDGLMGAVTWTGQEVGTGGGFFDVPSTDPSDTLTNMRLFRLADDTTLTYVAGTADEVRIDTPSLEFPRGGIWADDVDASASAVAFDFPVVAPPQAALFVETHLGAQVVNSVEFAHYPRWHTYAAS